MSEPTQQPTAPPAASAAGSNWNIPNALTLSRLLLGLVVCMLIARAWFTAALVVFIIAALTDAADGWVARALHQTSQLGRQLDPLVDKIFVIIVLVHLLPLVPMPAFPWIVTIIVVRELVVQALRSLVEGRGVAFGARWSGKLKTASQCLAVGLVLASLANPNLPGIFPARDITLWFVAALTLYSGVEYLVAASRIARSSGITT